MKKFYITLSLAATVAMSGLSQTKFDSYSLGAIGFYKEIRQNPALQQIKPASMPFEMATVGRAGETVASVLIKLAPGGTVDDIMAAGLSIDNVIGTTMCLATGSVEDILALENLDAVEAMSLGAPVYPKLDMARRLSGVDQIHTGEGLSQAYTGKGVVVGTLDTGLDPNHINFYNKEFTASRVKAIYQYTSSSTNAKAFTSASQISQFTSDNLTQSHGTHTMGILTGAFMLPGNKGNAYPSGLSAYFDTKGTFQYSNSNPCPYYGVAPDADIIVNCSNYLNNNQAIAATQNIINYAKEHNLPAVVSLSLGTNQGSHDGLGTFGMAIDELSKDAIICVSAGNEGESNISVVKTLTESDPVAKTFVNVKSSSSGLIEIYGSDENSFNLGVAIVDLRTGQVLSRKDFEAEGSKFYATSNFAGAGWLNDAQFDKTFQNSYLQITISNNRTTSRRHGVTISYSLTPNVSGNPDSNLALALICEGPTGQRIDIVNSPASGDATLSSNNKAGYSAPTPDLTINDLACSKGVISVGSWTTRNNWPTLGTELITVRSYKVDEASPFSSYGTLYDGRQLPEICAPGAMIVSSFNSYNTTDAATNRDYVARYSYKGRYYVWQEMMGTSMAAPFCAGVIATWLEAMPSLTTADVKDIIKKTSDPVGGHAEKGVGGKLNAYNGLKEVLNQNAVNNISVSEDRVMVKAQGNMFEVFVPGGDVNVAVYGINGQLVRKDRTNEDTLVLDLNDVNKGIYLLNVNGVYTERIAVR